MASRCEVPPKSASVVVDLRDSQWYDHEWMSKRAQTQLAEAADVDLRGSLESWLRKPDGTSLSLSRDGGFAGRVREGRWATRTSSCCL